MPNLYYICTKLNTMTGANYIRNYANNHTSLTVNEIVSAFDMKPVTVRQLLSRLASAGEIVRIGYGKYMKSSIKEDFPIFVSDKVRQIYNGLHSDLPFADFCVYSGQIYEPLQHHLSVNHAIYVETNRDTVESVFSLLKSQYNNVYKQPDADFMSDYVDLRKDCIIVKVLVTESPLQKVEDIPSPTIEKLLVDILTDADLNYLRGMELNYMIDTALSKFRISSSKLMRYARRRNVQKQIKNLLDNSTNAII